MAEPAESIIKKFGGITALSRELGHEHPTTVQGWKDRGVIPVRQFPAVLAAAQRKGIELTLEDLLGSHAEAAE